MVKKCTASKVLLDYYTSGITRRIIKYNNMVHQQKGNSEHTLKHNLRYLYKILKECLDLKKVYPRA